MHDRNNTYSWYEPDANKNGGSEGVKDDEGFDTYAFTNAVNAKGLCGAKDWRMPTKGELGGLAYCSGNKTQTLGNEEHDDLCTGLRSRPTINTTYFPDTEENTTFWSSSPNAYASYNAWMVDFGNGFFGRGYKSNYSNVRLVR